MITQECQIPLLERPIDIIPSTILRIRLFYVFILFAGLRMPCHSRLACIPGGLELIRSAVPLVQVWISFFGLSFSFFLLTRHLWGALVLVRPYLKRVHSLAHGSSTESSSFFFITYKQSV